MPSARGGIATRMVTALLAFMTVWYRKRTKTKGRKPADYHRRINSTIADHIYTVPVAEGHPAGAVHSGESICVTGYTPEELGAKPELWIDMICAKDREAVRTRLLQSLLANGLESLGRELATWEDLDLRRLLNDLDRLRDEVHIDFLLQDLPGTKENEAQETTSDGKENRVVCGR